MDGPLELEEMQVGRSARWPAEPCSLLLHPLLCGHRQVANLDPLLPQLGTPHSRGIRLKSFLLVEM